MRENLKLESHPSFQERPSGTTIDARWYRVYRIRQRAKTPQPHIVADEFLIGGRVRREGRCQESASRARVPMRNRPALSRGRKIHLPVVSFHLQKALRMGPRSTRNRNRSNQNRKGNRILPTEET